MGWIWVSAHSPNPRSPLFYDYVLFMFLCFYVFLFYVFMFLWLRSFFFLVSPPFTFKSLVYIILFVLRAGAGLLSNYMSIHSSHRLGALIFLLLHNIDIFMLCLCSCSAWCYDLFPFSCPPFFHLYGDCFGPLIPGCCWYVRSARDQFECAPTTWTPWVPSGEHLQFASWDFYSFYTVFFNFYYLSILYPI